MLAFISRWRERTFHVYSLSELEACIYELTGSKEIAKRCRDEHAFYTKQLLSAGSERHAGIVYSIYITSDGQMVPITGLYKAVSFLRPLTFMGLKSLALSMSVRINPYVQDEEWGKEIQVKFWDMLKELIPVSKRSQGARLLLAD